MNGGSLQQAWQLFEMGRYEQALEAASRARASEQDRAAAAYLASLCLTNLGRFDQAKQAASEALGEDGNRPEYHHAWGFAHYREATDGRSVARMLFRQKTTFDQPLQEAEGAYLRAVQLDPNDPYYHEMLGWVYHQQDRYDLAERALRNALQLDPRRSDCFQLLSEVCRLTGRYKESYRYALEALAFNAVESGGHASLGWAKLMHGDARESLGIFREALRLDPQDDNARLGLIETLKVQYAVIRWPYRTLQRLDHITDRPWWDRWNFLAWPLTAVLFAFIGLVIFHDIVSAVAGFFLGLALGWIVWYAVIFLPIGLMILQSMCNAVLLWHPLGRHALTPWQRYRAVAYNGYVLPVLASVALVFAGLALPDFRFTFELFSGRVFALVLLAGPFAAWAAATTTNWVYPVAAVALVSVVCFATYSLGLPPGTVLSQSPWPLLLFLAGSAWGLLVASRL